MKVLLLTQWFHPEPETRCSGLAKGLVERGHQVTVITGFPNYPSGKVYPGYPIKWRQWEDYHGARVLRLPLYPDHSRSTIRRALNYLSFAASVLILAPLFAGGAEIMWVYHPPLTVGIPALWLKLLWRIPFVYEVQDMWPETIASSGMAPSSVALTALGRFAQFVYRQAAAIAVISPGFKDNLIAKGVPPGKIHIIPNWIEEDLYQPAQRDPVIGAQYGFQDHFNIIFAGNMGPAQNLSQVIHAAASLTDMSRIQFVFIGDGLELNNLQAEVRQLGLGNVIFLGRQPPQHMATLLAWADVLLVHLRDDPLFQITIPSKLIAYMASAHPILCAVAGNAAEIIERAGAGLTCQPDSPAMLRETVLKFYSLSPEERKSIGQAGRRAFLSDYNQDALIEVYDMLFRQVIRNSLPCRERIQVG